MLNIQPEVLSTDAAAKAAELEESKFSLEVDDQDRIYDTIPGDEGPPKYANMTTLNEPADTSTYNSKPVETSRYSNPFSPSDYYEPLDNSDSSKPVDTSGYTKPLDSSDSSKPVDTSGYTKPMDGSDSSKPVDTTGYTDTVNRSGYLNTSSYTDTVNRGGYSNTSGYTDTVNRRGYTQLDVDLVATPNPYDPLPICSRSRDASYEQIPT